MIKTNFKIVATVLALHVPKHLCDNFKKLNELNKESNHAFDSVSELVESSVIALMHEAYEQITAEQTPLHILEIFVPSLSAFLDHEELGHLSDFLCSIHDNQEKVTADLNKAGINIKFNEDGVSISTSKISSPAPTNLH